MIQVSKEEAKLIREKIPNAPLKRTVHKYYAEEQPAILRLIGHAPQHKEVKRFAKQKSK